MTVSPTDFQKNGLGTLLQLLNEREVFSASTTTTDAITTSIYSLELGTNSVTTIRATVVAIRSVGVVIAKFVREFTAKRVGSGSAILLQDLVPSPDYKEDENLDVTSSVSGPNADILVTGITGTVEWRALIEVI